MIRTGLWVWAGSPYNVKMFGRIAWGTTNHGTCARLAGEKSAIGGVKGRSRVSFHSGANPSYTFVLFLVVKIEHHFGSGGCR